MSESDWDDSGYPDMDPPADGSQPFIDGSSAKGFGRSGNSSFTAKYVERPDMLNRFVGSAQSIALSVICCESGQSVKLKLIPPRLWRCPICGTPMLVPRARCTECRRKGRRIGHWYP
jgi:hypothetical protein